MNVSRATRLWILGLFVALSAAACEAVDHTVGAGTKDGLLNGAGGSDSAVGGSVSAAGGSDSAVGGGGFWENGSTTTVNGGDVAAPSVSSTTAPDGATGSGGNGSVNSSNGGDAAAASETDGGSCNDEDECQAPACDDGVTNGDESDEDCGGDCEERCPLGDHCEADRDCDTEICDLVLEECVSCNDMKQNGSELGEDCGGDDCALCKPGEMCTDDEGCVNYLCDDGTCKTGLALDYSCYQCGNQIVTDKISYIITLRNLSTKAINVNDVQIRYYLSAEVTDNLSFECAYQETSSCGQTRLRTSNFENSPTATHYVETVVGSMETIEPNGSATVEVSVLLGGRPVEQQGDFSFNMDMPQPNYQRITLHRAGSLIWGALPE